MSYFSRRQYAVAYSPRLNNISVEGYNVVATVRQNSLPSRRYLTWSNNHDSWNLWLKLSYLSLQLIDLGLTLLAVNLGFLELNPFIRGILTTPMQLAMMKLFIPFLIVCLVPGKLLVPGIALLSVVVAWNIKELLLLLF